MIPIINNSKDKTDYDKSTGIVDYFDKKFQNLPTRHKGDFRYLKNNEFLMFFATFVYKAVI